MEKVFTDIYENCKWGNNKNDKYKGSSGGGSDIDYNKDIYIPFIKSFIKDNQVSSVVDLGCGDFRCGPLIYNDLDVSYTGYDVYHKLIDYNRENHKLPKYNFIHFDFYNHREQLINADMCILKDVIQHWSLDNIYTFLDYLVENKKYKYILIINCCNQHSDNTDIKNGEYRELSSNFLPLKKYNPKKMFNYNTKEVSVIYT